MLVFPQWSPQAAEGCRAQHWTPPQRFAHYIARPVPLPTAPTYPPQLSDEDSLGGSSPERTDVSEDISVCEWRGCGARCAGVARLSAHVARTHAHPHRDGLFYCAWRGCARPHRGFNARYKMLVHVRTHTNERPHTCNQCQKSFSRAENLKIHLRSHSGEKPYVCPYEGCGKAYSNSSDRFKHTRTHTVDKPYCCKVPDCNKRYTDPSSLRKHVKTYKHYVPKDLPKLDSSDETVSPAMSPEYATESPYPPTSPLRITTHIPYSPPRVPLSPNYTETMPGIPQPMYASLDKLYIRPEHYPMRIPTYEMSYVEYTQMYEHAYRSHYGPRLNYPVLSVDDKAYAKETEPHRVDLQRYSPMETEEAPLNLKCARLELRPIEELIRRTDLPLDLSTKS